ncbi:NADPH:quinone reductase [Amnibacterium kyonggiense]|uniref:NADPH2:quinone reductase n=1 Tax=Amnibacterium kyonggiense TaxID=595671 RepID=A0A4R7FKV2_9MICO|nr:NADPH:quinone reductase [Amnibacterium kyonggiense]TDS76985.1 NADPH2:quinone reductase [Amnibacterium kyonggiense]
MRAIVYDRAGGPEVLRLVDKEPREPGPGEVRVRIAVSGVNPTDWKSRSGTDPEAPQTPDQDGSGTVDAVGEDVDLEPGDRVWVFEAAYRNPDGTAEELAVVPADRVVPLPDGASFDLGAALGVPALTAHIALRAGDPVPLPLAPGELSGRTVLVAGGAGAVGHAAIELAGWAGATVITTVSSPAKAALARAAGAHHVVDYRAEDAAAAIRRIAPDGVDLVVEVNPNANAELDAEVLAPDGTIAVYATDTPEPLAFAVRPFMAKNLRWRFLLVYTAPAAEKAAAVDGVRAAVAAGALRVGEEAGLPLTRFPLERTGDAHAAVEQGAVGKVLIDV